jgi:hypothetical protein
MYRWDFVRQAVSSGSTDAATTTSAAAAAAAIVAATAAAAAAVPCWDFFAAKVLKVNMNMLTKPSRSPAVKVRLGLGEGGQVQLQVLLAPSVPPPLALCMIAPLLRM